MDLTAFFDSELSEHLKVAEAVRASLAGPFASLTENCVSSLRDGGKILFFGNGGSASDAQHLATELTVRYIKDRPAIAAIALTTDGSALTAAGNDLGFDKLFSRQIEALGRPGDVAIGISTSGRSPNVIEGLKMARKKGLVAAGLSGRTGGDMVGLADPLLKVPHDAAARIQEMHITIGQALCGAIEIELGLVEA
ncbi:D-sedoheptulose 7-phosphate isomerase [Nisaea nitritireducens]|uniref:D-sedoheptulose 7-phosphate isomerase n=1 Tax=Nisaea nitritireducens TaxID=568392 RepID=UPI0018693837|nr:D-sedoheptulose 7-phosphate isomerase [Nisaea nitritireducens]